MFVSYHSRMGYGYMCLKGTPPLKDIHRFLTYHVGADTKIVFMSRYTNNPVNNIVMHADGEHRQEIICCSLKNVEGVHDLYGYLYDKWGSVSLIGYTKATDKSQDGTVIHTIGIK